NAGNQNALVALQRTRSLDGTEAAIALAKKKLRRTGAVIAGDIECDGLGHGTRVAANAPEILAIVRLDRAAPACPDRVDQDEVREREPSLRVVAQGRARSIVTVRTKIENSRSDEAEMQKRRCRPGATVKYEREWPVGTAILHHVSGVKDRCGLLAGLIVKRKSAGSRCIGQRSACCTYRVFRYGIRRQQPQHAPLRRASFGRARRRRVLCG